MLKLIQKQIYDFLEFPPKEKIEFSQNTLEIKINKKMRYVLKYICETNVRIFFCDLRDFSTKKKVFLESRQIYGNNIIDGRHKPGTGCFGLLWWMFLFDDNKIKM